MEVLRMHFLALSQYLKPWINQHTTWNTWSTSQVRFKEPLSRQWSLWIFAEMFVENSLDIFKPWFFVRWCITLTHLFILTLYFVTMASPKFYSLENILEVARPYGHWFFELLGTTPSLPKPALAVPPTVLLPGLTGMPPMLSAPGGWSVLKAFLFDVFSYVLTNLLYFFWSSFGSYL